MSEEAAAAIPGAQAAILLDRYRVTTAKRFRLRDRPTDDPGAHPADKDGGVAMLADGVERLSALQQRLYASGRSALLVAFQAMDAAGKDGTIRHVMSGVNPQGVEVTSFKQPSHEELRHDYLWRIHHHVPERGKIGIFNRSHYEDVLVARVHPDAVEAQALPGDPGHDKFWRRRLKDITQFEAYLGRQGIHVVKVFLHVSLAEQRRRFLARLDDPHKTWKFSAADLAERARWNDYQTAYQDAIARTATPEAPWYVVPADTKWFAHLVVVEALIAALNALDLHLPRIEPTERESLSAARTQLEAEEPPTA